MRTAIPPMTEQGDDLKHRLQREHDGHKKPRLQMLYLLASGQTQTRQEVARLLGVHRHTIGRWLAIDAAGGLEALLQTYVPAGQPVSLAPAVLASLEQALHRPEGFASDEALRPWVWRTHGVAVRYKTLYTLVRTRFRAQLKVPRPRHPKKAGGHSRVPGHLSRAPAARHSAGEYTADPGVEPR
jgi:transposase